MEIRRNARMYAVQAIFQYFFNKQDICSVINQFSSYEVETGNEKKISYDENFFSLIVKGVDANKTFIKELIEENLSSEWNYNRIDITLKAILSLGIFELKNCKDIPLKVIIDEYVTISKMYCNNNNIGFINGILDNIGKKVRTDE